jgi:stage II sporulation protein D
MNRHSARWLSFALALSATVSVCLHPLAAAATLQDSPNQTRPRRADQQEAHQKRDGPIIRVGLMTDVSSVALSAPYGLSVRRSTDDDQKTVLSQLRVETRSIPIAAPERQYQAEVASVADSSEARRISDEVKKKFRETVSTLYDAKEKKYKVFIGRFDTREEAAQVVERLRRADFKSARVAADQSKDENPVAREKKPAYSPRYTETPARSARQSVLQIAAFDAGKLVAASVDILIITPARSQEVDRQVAVKAVSHENKNDDGAKPSTQESKPLAVRVGSRDYRGEIHLLLNSRGRINVINALTLEEYLRGVVPMELSPGAFPQLEALKAQAVAARSYALSTQGRYREEGFDLRDDAQSQVYGGLTAEHPLTNRAVEETRGVVAMYYEKGRGSLTENNEAIFQGKPLPYLRSVECAPESTERREIRSNRAVEAIPVSDGRSLARAIALLEVTGFSLPARPQVQYLRGAADQSELMRWADRLSALRRGKAKALRGDVTRLPGFASLISWAVYGEGRESRLLSSADVDYMLAGLGGQDISPEARADLALLLKEGVLRLAENRLSAQTTVTRAWAIETFARALYLKPQISNLKTQTVHPSEEGRLVVAASESGDGRAQVKPATLERIEVEKGAWLFRRFGSESYATDHLALIGGERVAYHLNSAGRVDFLEAEIAGRGASSDRYSSLAHWQERISVEELSRRLTRARGWTGEVSDLVPVEYGASGRVIELEAMSGSQSVRLRGSQIRNALGLKENLFVIDAERDERGRPTAFVFTGRGWGHGVGLCQTGAYGLAKEGYSYMAILQKYYTGVKAHRIY